MAKIKLELEKLEILRPKERWQLYFVVITEHPEDSNKVMITTTPSPYIRLKPRQGNTIHFEPEGIGTDGFTLLVCEMPENRRMKTRIYLRHSRKNTRSIGKLINDIKVSIGSEAGEVVNNLMGVSSPWLIASKASFNMLEGVLKNIKDRDFGFVNLDEEFGNEFENQIELDRTNNFSTGDAKLTWSWSIDD